MLNELDRHAFFRYYRLDMSAQGIAEGQRELLRVIEQTLPMRALDAAASDSLLAYAGRAFAIIDGAL